MHEEAQVRQRVRTYLGLGVGEWVVGYTAQGRGLAGMRAGRES